MLLGRSMQACHEHCWRADDGPTWNAGMFFFGDYSGD